MRNRLFALLSATLILLSALIAVPHAVTGAIFSHDLISGVAYADRGLMAEQMVDIDAPAGILVTRSGQVLWSRNADEHRSIASITKVMTAILALENGNPDDMVEISYEAATIGGSTANLAVGEVYPLGDLIEMMMLASGNDAAIALSEHVGTQLGNQPNRDEGQDPGVEIGFEGGSAGSEAFIALMNQKATELGMGDTRFENPQGYDGENHYSSAADVAKMVTYAMAIPRFREIVASPDLPDSLIQNTNQLLRTFPGANGVKTGMTDSAGNCVAASALRDDIEIYAVVLGSSTEDSRFTDAAALLTFGFDHYASRTLMEAGTILGTAEVLDYLDVGVEVGVDHEVTAVYFDLLGPVEHHVGIEPVRAPVEVGTIVGFISFTQNGIEIAREKIVSFEAVDKPTFFESISIGQINSSFQQIST